MGPKREEKRKMIEAESESSTTPKRKSVRVSSQASQGIQVSLDMDLTLAASHLRLNSGLGSSYDLDDIPSSVSGFINRAVEAFNVTFKSAKVLNDVIPNIDSTYRAVLSIILLSESNTYNLDII